MVLQALRRVHRSNVDTLRRSPLAEISGALGDLGTLLPLMIALSLQGSVSLSATLVLTGLSNLATGLVFGIPLPVQPMKAIAAAAISSHASLGDTVAAGAWVGLAVLLLSLTGLLAALARTVPVPVVKGIQLGAGLSLVVSAGAALLRPLRWRAPWCDNRLWALAAFLGLLAAAPPRRGARRLPYALVACLVGLALAVLARAAAHRPLPSPALWRPRLYAPAFRRADALGMAVAQLPLTVLNSIVATAALAADLAARGELAAPAPSPAALGLSVAAMNLLGCWLGAMPTCHGAGGLAAQHRFGARSGASVALLGAAKLALGLLWGGGGGGGGGDGGDDALAALLAAFPRAILGVLVLAAGLELARAAAGLNHDALDLRDEEPAAADDDGHARVPPFLSTTGTRRHGYRHVPDEERAERWTVMTMTAAGILAFQSDAVGCAAGLLCHGAYRLSEALERRRGRGRRPGESTPLLR